MAGQWSTTTGASTKSDRRKMTTGQVGAMLHKLGLEPQNEDDTHFMILCPFHANYRSAACSVAKDSGYFLCFNAACGARGQFDELVNHIKGWDYFRCKRFIQSNEGEEKSYEEVMAEIEASIFKMPTFPQDTLDKMRKAFLESEKAQDYMHWRGFEDDTLDHFRMGYDPHRDMICTPMFDNTGNPVGVIGRSIDGEKRFKNSLDLPTKHTLFNIDNAKRAGAEEVILVESNFDAMMIHQAGYPNVCATLGGTFSDHHLSQIHRHFNGLILMTDADEAGIKFAARIAQKAQRVGIPVYQAKWSETELFPHGAKDVSDQDKDGNLILSPQDIVFCIQNRDMVIVD